MPDALCDSFYIIAWTFPFVNGFCNISFLLFFDIFCFLRSGIACINCKLERKLPKALDKKQKMLYNSISWKGFHTNIIVQR